MWREGFKDVITLKMKLLEGALLPSDCDFIGGNGTQRDSRGSGTEGGPRVETARGPPSASQGQRPRQKPSLLAPRPRTSSLQNCGKINVFFFPTNFHGSCHSIRGTLLRQLRKTATATKINKVDSVRSAMRKMTSGDGGGGDPNFDCREDGAEEGQLGWDLTAKKKRNIKSRGKNDAQSLVKSPRRCHHRRRLESWSAAPFPR